jgi:hypothetical protein
VAFNFGIKVMIGLFANDNETYTCTLTGLNEQPGPTTVPMPGEPVARSLRGIFLFTQIELKTMKEEADREGCSDSAWFETTLGDLRAFGFRGLPEDLAL